MSKIFLIIGIIVLIAFLVFRFGFKSASSELKNETRPTDSLKPATMKDNDKMVLVQNIKFDYLKQAIKQFCNMYNQENFLALPRLFLGENKYIITFPYDIDFERFCYFINYIENAHELSLLPDYHPEVKAWCSTNVGDAWMKDGIANKNVMIYIPDWDDEHDNVYLTTQDNLGFKMGFALGEQSKQLERPVLRFEPNPFEFNSINELEKIDFE